jgi:hypothetical protein
MLRNLVLALAILVAAAGGVGVALVGRPAIGLLVTGLVVVVGCLFERVHYKRLRASVTDPRFQPTPERFRDPTSGDVVRVYADPATGERLYVRD